MREILSKQYYLNTVEDWLIAAIYIAGGIVVAKFLYWVIGKTIKRATEKTKTRLDDILIDMLEEPIIFAIAIFGFYLGMESLNKTEAVADFIHKVYHVLIIINATWLVVRIINALVEEYLVPMSQKTESDLDDHLLPVIKKVVTIGLWSVGIIVALNNAGYDVAALIAGLGIGGIALAMAAKNFVENIFGGITVFTDKPFLIKDRIKINDYDGIVEDIGIRSTKIRTLEGRLVTLPNFFFIGNAVENVSSEPTRKVVLELGLTYDTSPEQMGKAMQILKEIANSHSDLITEDTLISFTTFGDFSLGITFIYYIKKEADIFNTQSIMNTDILAKFNEAGLEFAFPTQTLYNIKQEVKA